MTSAMGVGSVVGGLLVAAKGRTGIRTLVVLVAVFGVAMFGLTFSPNLLVAIVVLFVIGNLSIAFVSIANSTMQLTADPQMRGRVIALWSIGFFGMTPVGALLIGAISQHFGPRVGIGIGAVACFVSAGLGEYLYRRVLRRRMADAAPSPARVVDPVRIVSPERAIDGREPVPSGRAATG
jgi:MFS family permease